MDLRDLGDRAQAVAVALNSVRWGDDTRELVWEHGTTSEIERALLRTDGPATGLVFDDNLPLRERMAWARRWRARSRDPRGWTRWLQKMIQRFGWNLVDPQGELWKQEERQEPKRGIDDGPEPLEVVWLDRWAPLDCGVWVHASLGALQSDLPIRHWVPTVTRSLWETLLPVGATLCEWSPSCRPPDRIGHRLLLTSDPSELLHCPQWMRDHAQVPALSRSSEAMSAIVMSDCASAAEMARLGWTPGVRHVVLVGSPFALGSAKGLRLLGNWLARAPDLVVCAARPHRAADAAELEERLCQTLAPHLRARWRWLRPWVAGREAEQVLLAATALVALPGSGAALWLQQHMGGKVTMYTSWTQLFRHDFSVNLHGSSCTYPGIDGVCGSDDRSDVVSGGKGRDDTREIHGGRTGIPRAPHGKSSRGRQCSGETTGLHSASAGCTGARERGTGPVLSSQYRPAAQALPRGPHRREPC